MILNNEEKKRFIDNLSWMIVDMQRRHDELKGNLEDGSQGDYSPELKEAMNLLEDIKQVETTETTGCHRKAVSVNCREFGCISNRQGTCALPKVTFESSGALIIGKLKCVQAGKLEKKKGEE